ncbi:MAG: hypothetical protein J6I85_03855 [Clostridia bacterium]|nr:hypothetical protein [Clostridia bacterium]
MNNKDCKPVSNDLTLTIKKENRITLKKVTKKLSRMTVKTVFYLFLLTLANIFI